MRSVAGRVPLRWRSSRVTPNLARPPAQRGVEDRRLSRSTRRGAPIRIPPTAEAPAPPGFVGRDALGFGLSSHAAAFSLLPSVPRNGHRGSPCVQPPAAHFVLPVRPLRALPRRRPPARRRLLPVQQSWLALQVRALGVAALLHAAPRARLSRRQWLGLLSFLDGGRPFDERHFELCQHQLLGLGCVFEPLFQVRFASIAHEIVLMLLVRPAGGNGEIGGIA